MAGTQQYPTSNWPTNPGYGPGLGTVTGPGAGFPDRRRRRRRILLAVVISVAVVVAAAVAVVAVAAHPKGKLVLPGSLLGLSKATSASATHLAGQIKAAEKSGADGKLSNVVAGVYGSLTGPRFLVTGGGICGACSAKSAATQRGNLVAAGYPNAKSFPAGANGGVLACGSRSSQGSTLLRCAWVDDRTAGDVVFDDGVATSLADAAAKTKQVIAATEH
ncbi:MAG TPA: hypothetical protein VFI65_31280 [Streptosporangiaceae bacterium]|nr:hypothetical protein [Streptosporangiaceae bacterium]